jgi:hypothetical protein
MTQDLVDTISALQNAAVGRCRKRIEEAALRAKGIIRVDVPDVPDMYRHTSCGVTSVLKRRHGL